MFQRILVPLDGSTRAERAISIAARLARASGGVVILLSVINEVNEYWFPVTASQIRLTETYVAADIAEAEKYLANLTVSPDLKDVATETILLPGQAAPTILSVATSSRAGIIVMCSHGYTGMKRWMLGSVAEKVAQAAPIPVLLLRDSGTFPLGPHTDDTRPVRVLVPLDGSTHAKDALVPAAYLVTALTTPERGAIHLLRVAKPLPAMNKVEQHHERGRMLQRAKGYLSMTTKQIREGLVAHPIADFKLPVTWSVSTDPDVAEAIIRVAENGEDVEGAGVFGGCDIIAMATHGRSGLDRWAMGSVTERVLHATKLPLLIVRPTTKPNERHTTEKVAIHHT